ncbi:uncharacterized protein LOC144881957 isoform X2 [Branchiostoma floridae x Branchiostoma japonicum]
MLSYRSVTWRFYPEVQISSEEHTWYRARLGGSTQCHTCSPANLLSFFFYSVLQAINKMFWGLTLEVGKQYTQIVEEGFHITRATLDPLTIKGKEGEGDVHLVYILRLRHNKQDYILCTLEPSKQYSEPLDLSFSEGEEVSFFLEGSDEGTLHLTGYLEELQSMPPEEVMLDSDMEEMSSEEEEEEEEESSEEEEVPNGLSLHALTAGDELEEESEEEWAPNSGNSKKRKRAGVAEKGKKKRKKSASSTSTSTSTPSTGEEEDEDDEELSDELDDEEEDSDEFDSEDDEEEEESEEESEEEEEEDSEGGESAMDGVRGVLNFEENEMSDSASGEDSEEEESETTHSEPSTPGDTPEVKGKKPQQKSNKKGQPQGQKTAVKQQKNDVKTPAAESLTGKKKKAQQQGKTDDDKTAEKGAPQTKKEKETPKAKVVNGEAPKPKEQTQTASQKKKNKRKSGKELQDGATTQNPASEQAAGPNSNKKKAATPAKQVLPGGLVVIDRELGAGKVAKAGRRVGMYYKGTLAQNNKPFDSRQNGKPFTFTLGHGEVIKGWDMGVQGMKIGGKRRLEIPPALAYGSQRVGPIPANSKLIFEVELKSVS